MDIKDTNEAAEEMWGAIAAQEAAQKTVKLASPKQLKWLRDLLVQKDTTNLPYQERIAEIKAAFDGLTEEGYGPESVNTALTVSDKKPITMDGFKVLLELLQKAPGVEGAQGKSEQDFPSVEALPEGRYGIPTEDGALNKTAFYKVDRPTEGKWAGYVFVKLCVSESLERLAVPVQKSVANKIVAYGVAKASALYGQEYKHCGVCGIGLTNDTSREIGIGPECRKKMGW